MAGSPIEQFLEDFLPGIAQTKAAGKCINCGTLPTEEDKAKWSELGRREFQISGMCEPCFDRVFAEPEDSGELEDCPNPNCNGSCNVCSYK